MAGPTTTLGSPLNVSGGGNAGASQSSTVNESFDAVTGQVRQQTEQFSGLLQDPNFTGQSEMGAMLKLQREFSLQQMVYQTVSNIMKGNTDTTKQAINNMK